MSDPEIETSPSEAVTSEDVARKIGAVTDSLTEQLAHLCELMKELRHGQTHRRHEATARSRAASTSTGSITWSDMVPGTAHPAFATVSTLAPLDRLTSPKSPTHHRGFSLDDEDERSVEKTSTQINQVVQAINSLPAILQRDVTQTKVQHTQVPNFIGSKDEINEFKHFLLNQLQPDRHRINEETKLHYFQNILRDEASESWQTLRINSKPPLETSSSYSGKNLLGKISKKSSDTSETN